jgi:hypothetical protein
MAGCIAALSVAIAVVRTPAFLPSLPTWLLLVRGLCFGIVAVALSRRSRIAGIALVGLVVLGIVANGGLTWLSAVFGIFAVAAARRTFVLSKAK